MAYGRGCPEMRPLQARCTMYHPVFTLCGALRSSELPVRATAARSLRLLAAGARLLFAPGDLGYFLFFFHIFGENESARRPV